ncbi:hypothetical protein Scep_009547 [Stephania cephalantha]|uniref:CCHC-type domain-containing protein n=1 Tax=Stephania cephalantha TaxID=152367 RepID=A0AAP0JTD1_9MAGN
MPATAGRVRMPANNRVHSSAALQTHGIWQSAIGYDPYAPTKDDAGKSSQANNASNSEPEGENAYTSFQGLLALARITGSNADEVRGACKKCGRVGHLTFQCRNFLSLKEDKEKDPIALVASGLDKLKENGAKMDKSKAFMESSEESSEEESDDSDSEVDSEIERIIAARNGKKSGGKVKSSSKKQRISDSEDSSDSGDKKKRGRSTKRRSEKRAATSDSDEEDRKRRRDRRKRRGESSKLDDDRHHRHRKSRKEKKRRRSHKHHADDSDSSEKSDRHRKRRSRRAASGSDSDGTSPDDSRLGREMKRSEKRKRNLEEKV